MGVIPTATKCAITHVWILDGSFNWFMLRHNELSIISHIFLFLQKNNEEGTGKCSSQKKMRATINARKVIRQEESEETSASINPKEKLKNISETTLILLQDLRKEREQTQVFVPCLMLLLFVCDKMSWCP